MRFTLLPPLVLLLFSFATANTENVTVTLFPAIPEVTEIAANSSIVAMIKETGAPSTHYGINMKRAKSTGTTTAVPTVNSDFYIDVTTYPNGKSQVLNYFTGAFPFTQVAEVTCSFEGTTSAVCQVTRLSEETGVAMAPGSLTSSEVRYAEAEMTFLPVVFKDMPAASSKKLEASSASSLRVFVLPGLVVSMVAAAVVLL